MIQRLKRILASLAIVVVAYFVYLLLAVPLLEPEALAEKNDDTGSERPIDPAGGSESRHRKFFSQYFQPGDWELENPKVLENERAMLLVKDYSNRPDGTVELRPCTMIFFPKGQSEPGQPAAQAIIMKAPDGAVLQFDEGFDLTRGRIGKLTGGKLSGQITIYSSPNKTANDELRIVTRDVQMEDDRIWTPHPVEFRFGQNNGSGREMQIALATAGDTESKKAGLGFSGIESLELVHEVKMKMQMGHGGLLPGESKSEPRRPTNRPADPAADPPVEITCQGPFRFDLVQRVATFNDRVDALRVNAEGPSDQMTCEQLAIYFNQRDAAGNATGGGTTNPKANPLANLHPQAIEAKGDPVIVRSPSTGGNARCQRLEYDIVEDRITLEGSEDILLNQGANEIRTRRLEYQPAEPGHLGWLLASGPGTLQGAMPKDPSQKFQARWTKELRLRPHEQNQVVSLRGSAQMRFTDLGALAAEEIHLWLLESAAVQPVAGTYTALKPVSSGNPAQRVVIQPDRMMALGNVQFDSPQLTGSTKRLEVWFQQTALESPGNARSSANSSATNNSPPNTSPFARPGERRPGNVAGNATNQSFNLVGDLLRMQVDMRGPAASLADASIEGNARFAETKTARPGDKPLLVTGDSLHVAQADTDQTQVTVAGKPASIEARGMSLSGAKIQLERASNRVRVDNAGRMTLPVTRDLSGGAPLQNQTLEVTWQGGMLFDGRTARFERSVVARAEHQLLRTERLDVTLVKPISLANPATPGRGGEKPQVDEIDCAGGVFFENRSFDERGQTSIDQMQIGDLSINQTTGAIKGRGPGWLTSVRRGGSNALFAQPGDAAAGQPVDNGAADRAAADKDALSFLDVHFERSLTGNLLKREITFADQVKAVYGPVANWESKLDPENPDSLGPKGVTLICDQLTVRQMPPPQPSQRGTVELEAQGNTLVEGRTFTARAYRMTYAEAKELLVLEGNGQSDAQLFRQPEPGGETSRAAARKIMYWRSTNRVEVDDARYLDLSNFGASPAPPPDKKNGTKPKRRFPF